MISSQSRQISSIDNETYQKGHIFNLNFIP